jgi:hypothetical protein
MYGEDSAGEHRERDEPAKIVAGRRPSSVSDTEPLFHQPAAMATSDRSASDSAARVFGNRNASSAVALMTSGGTRAMPQTAMRASPPFERAPEPDESARAAAARSAAD